MTWCSRPPGRYSICSPDPGSVSAPSGATSGFFVRASVFGAAAGVRSVPLSAADAATSGDAETSGSSGLSVVGPSSTSGSSVVADGSSSAVGSSVVAAGWSSAVGSSVAGSSPRPWQARHRARPPRRLLRPPAARSTPGRRRRSGVRWPRRSARRARRRRSARSSPSGRGVGGCGAQPQAWPARLGGGGRILGRAADPSPSASACASGSAAAARCRTPPRSGGPASTGCARSPAARRWEWRGCPRAPRSDAPASGPRTRARSANASDRPRTVRPADAAAARRSARSWGSGAPALGGRELRFSARATRPSARVSANSCSQAP